LAKKRLIETAIWKDKWFRKLSRDTREIYLFLLSGPDTLESGFVEMPDEILKAYLPHVKNIGKARKELYPKIQFDDKQDLYLMVKFYEKNCKSPKMIKPALNDLEKFKNSRLVVVFCDKYAYIKEFKLFLDTLCHTLPIRCSDNEQEQEQDNENDNILNKNIDRNKNKKIIFNSAILKFDNITPNKKEFWEKTYPAVNIDQELMRMVAWIIANPTKKKSNYERFINNWLVKEQDKPRNNNYQQTEWVDFDNKNMENLNDARPI